jgi:hypothetical protein
MAPLDQLPPDQRAALMLIIQQGQTYEDLASLLQTDVDAVRARALAALELVGPDVGQRLPTGTRAEITDYLLGQQSPARRDETRGMLKESDDARAWAGAVAAELKELVRDATLPEVPAESPGAPEQPPRAPEEAPAAPEQAAEVDSPTAVADAAAELRARRAGAARPVSPPEKPAKEPERERITGVASAIRPAWEADEGRRRGPARPASTRLGGLILILVLGGGLATAIVLYTNSNGGSSSSTAHSTPATPTATTTGGTSSTPTGTTGGNPVSVVATIPLSAANGSNGHGAAEIVQEQGTGTRAILIVGQGLAPSTSTTAYAVWLYNSAGDARSLGFFAQPVGSNGQLQGTAPVPANASHFKEIVVTREMSANPRHPGTIVLQGPFHLT